MCARPRPPRPTTPTLTRSFAPKIRDAESSRSSLPGPDESPAVLILQCSQFVLCHWRESNNAAPRMKSIRRCEHAILTRVFAPGQRLNVEDLAGKSWCQLYAGAAGPAVTRSGRADRHSTSKRDIRRDAVSARCGGNVRHSSRAGMSGGGNRGRERDRARISKPRERYSSGSPLRLNPKKIPTGMRPRTRNCTT